MQKHVIHMMDILGMHLRLMENGIKSIVRGMIRMMIGTILMKEDCILD